MRTVRVVFVVVLLAIAVSPFVFRHHGSVDRGGEWVIVRHDDYRHMDQNFTITVCMTRAQLGAAVVSGDHVYRLCARRKDGWYAWARQLPRREFGLAPVKHERYRLKPGFWLGHPGSCSVFRHNVWTSCW